MRFPLNFSRWLDGNRDELAPIRIPTLAEQQRREVARRRQFLAREIRCLANRGRGQVAEYCHASLPHRWWGARNWKKLATLDPWVLGILTQLRALILALEVQLQALDAEIKARAQDQVLPKGLGELTIVTLDGEICDWARFYNRKQVGSYTGWYPQLQLVGRKPARRLEGAESPVAAVHQVRHRGRCAVAHLSG